MLFGKKLDGFLLLSCCVCGSTVACKSIDSSGPGLKNKLFSQLAWPGTDSSDLKLKMKTTEKSFFSKRDHWEF